MPLFTVPGIIGCLQALEAIKIGSAVGDPFSGRMLLLDAISGQIRIVCFWSLMSIQPLMCMVFFVFSISYIL